MTKKLPTNDEQLAALDEVYALFRLGEFYRDAQIDGCKAIEYFTQEARRDELRTLAELAQIYLTDGVESEMSDANDYYSGAKEIGHVDEFKAIAEIFFKLNDGHKALEYFLKSNFEWREFYFSRMINSNGRRFSTSPA